MDKTTLSFRPQGVGKYKTAKAYVRLDPGEGRFIINGEPARAYFAENPRWRKALAPFKAAGLDEETFDIQARVVGRAKSWSKRQRRALAHAIAGALTALDPARRDQLRQAGFRFKVISGLDWLQKLPVEAWLALGVDPDELWAKHYALFLRSLPKKWAANPHVLTFGGRWLLDVLLIPLEDHDLKAVRDHIAEQDKVVSDVDILGDLFGITPRDDAFERWRFTLSYRLSQKSENLAVEFVGFDVVVGRDVLWRWALQKAPIEKPKHHHRPPGTEGLLTEEIEVEIIAAELSEGDERLDIPLDESKEEWKPTRQTWEYVLTYYGWEKGVLPYSREARAIIPPLSKGQPRAVLHFAAEQVADEPFEVTLYAHSKSAWLYDKELRDFFAGHLWPGARIWIDRTEKLGWYKIRYQPVEPQPRRLLFFEEGQVRPVIRKVVKVACEVDESMLLAESRYSNIKALDQLDLRDRRTAPKVLGAVFELIGLKDESRGVYCAQLDDVFPLLCITKPYAKSYVENILYSQKKYPWFYRDEERGTGWFVYNPEQDQVVVKRHRPRPVRPTRTIPVSAANRGLLVWQKTKLPASDVQRQPGHPTGGLRLTQAGWQVDGEGIDHTTYFREVVFGKLEWTVGNYQPKNREAVVVPFCATILGQSYGLRKLVVSHKPGGEAGQRNYTTMLHWGELSSTIRELNLVGRTFRLYAPPEGERAPFCIEII